MVSNGMPERHGSPDGSAYGSSEFLCGVCRWALTETCCNCGPELYWRSFEPRDQALETPPEFPSYRKWHKAGYGEKINILGFYTRALLKQGAGVDSYRSRS